MKKVNRYYHKKILVLGLAKSGVGAAALLHKLGAFVTVNDYKPLSENPEAQSLLEQGITVICGGHPIELLDEGFELIVKNPGIPYHNQMIKEAGERGIPIITEVELAYQISEAPFVAITGTNGKTTTTTLIDEILEAGNKAPLIAGNIGKVASVVAQKAAGDNTIVIELSSFQLMGIDEFKPRIAILTNLYDAHLDYHGTVDEYISAKANITRNQTEDDYFIVNADQEEVMKIARSSKAKIIPFSSKRTLEEGGYVKDGWIYFNEEKIMDTKDVVLPGAHNLENILSSVIAAKLLGVANEAIFKVLNSFAGVKHRLQYIGEIHERRFYNDSKATNILATQNALAAFDAPVVLLAGGLDRGNEFDELIPSFTNVKALVTFGQTAAKLEEAGSQAGIKTIIRVDNVEKAVPVAFQLSAPGDVVLLSPACASWDQYKTFEVRGDIFVEAVHKLK
ncbi:UDP-N-acetylmuramoylalanine--D-glutamate ligase [Cytobacillus horneckiae]|uniref:UDP-N-acetylmuramoylalanine--D-glutamate ligase n=1 Tax=Cytobacillus horneckiae TaxID=549687 RepID=A0A2N0ZBG2_9BACI|nr:UDP-N-acetylmuramoyl-L-alanine--D-glutamate ligase [Cytobacillus horneckiae]MBN6887064.1 UDP-N-acetylmuramoyl-L-alanine--D-glutamate ligase [Cytobacillus horneckiae]MCM3178345.1 UDP-N-acetylmuramoyl-L-alanine--D-glutamate ligase [Cytobacillus horneckiae]MEC1156915.1 UDP-N-acetylmuramoyl-L-alanine--D-glutamate ligase [Cytobacillus horneckiae]MED2940059.1 UDP-N-acetylmuramoyl-L-alanine--D-glutamate ligase [Cytobacillus horneckiae]PKG26848.1 UDP-N-acetylmuramoyl-L-alanine--D-glutamate ligase [